MSDPAQDPKLFRIYQQMFELNPEPLIFLSLAGKIKMMNDHVTRLTGYDEAELVGKSIFELPFFLPETIEGLKQKFVERMKGKPLEPYDVPVRAKDGTLLVGQTLGAICKSEIGIPIGVVIVVRDVTSERQAKQSLAASEHFSKLLFENTLNGIAYCKMIYDDNKVPVDFKYLEVNSAFDTIIGTKDIVNKTATEAFPGIKEDHPELFTIYGRVAETGKAEHIEFEFKPINKWLSISVYSPEKGYFVAIFEDITGRKAREIEMKQRIEKSEDINKLVIGRELKMVELKAKIARLENTIEVLGRDDHGQGT